MSFFTFPEDAHWNPELECVEFSVAIGAYEGTVRAPAELFRRLLRGPATPEKCLDAYHLQRTRFERAVAAKLKRKELADDGNVELVTRDLRPPSLDARKVTLTHLFSIHRSIT
jgi:uncharacterized protein DUF1488